MPLTRVSAVERKAMIDRSHALQVVRQAELSGLSRASVYYLPRATPEVDQRLMRRIDVLHLDYPVAGSRMLRGMLAREGIQVGGRHVVTLMAKMGSEALYHARSPSRSFASLRSLWPSRGGDLHLQD